MLGVRTRELFELVSPLVRHAAHRAGESFHLRGKRRQGVHPRASRAPCGSTGGNQGFGGSPAATSASFGRPRWRPSSTTAFTKPASPCWTTEAVRGAFHRAGRFVPLYGDAQRAHAHPEGRRHRPAAKIPYADVFDLVRVSMESKLHLVPRLRWRPVEVPGGFHHPMWVNDPNFNIGRHFYRSKIAAPGGQLEMDQAIAEIASIQLPRDRPLVGDLVARRARRRRRRVGDEDPPQPRRRCRLRRHDGEGDERSSPTRDDLNAPNPAWVPEPIPSRRRLITEAFRDQKHQLGAIGPLTKRTVKGSGQRAAEHQAPCDLGSAIRS